MSFVHFVPCRPMFVNDSKVPFFSLRSKSSESFLSFLLSVTKVFEISNLFQYILGMIVDVKLIYVNRQNSIVLW